MSKWQFGQVQRDWKNGVGMWMGGDVGGDYEGHYLRQRNATADIAEELAYMLEEVRPLMLNLCRSAEFQQQWHTKIGALLARFRVQEPETVMDQVKGTRDETMQIEILAHRLDKLIAEVRSK